MLTPQERWDKSARIVQMYKNLKFILDNNGGDRTDPEYLAVLAIVRELTEEQHADRLEQAAAIEAEKAAIQERQARFEALLANTEINAP